MDQYKKQPAIRMLAAEIRDTKVELRSSSKEDFQAAIFLSPSGADVNRVLMVGTAVELEDLGQDDSFFRVRVADPTGAVFVYAGKYQPEAAKAIQQLKVPCFVIVSGKLSHYTPDQGDTITSIRAEHIATVDVKLRDLALADSAHHTVFRLMAAKDDARVKEHYPDFDFKAFAASITEAVDQLLQDVPADARVSSKVPEPPKPPAEAKKEAAKKDEKGAAKPKGEKEAAKEPSKNVPKEEPKPPAKAESSPGLQDSTAFVLDLLKKHKQEGGISRDTLQNVITALGYAMLNVDNILAKLKEAGEIIEPRNGFFKAI
jgi:RPA family protein